MAKKKTLDIDSSALQYIPKGSFYNTTNAQNVAFRDILNKLFDHDRVIFSLLAGIVPGSRFSKGAMIHQLLSHPTEGAGNELVEYGIKEDYELDLMHYALSGMGIPGALKCLLMLSGVDDEATGNTLYRRVNNAKTKRLIFRYIFDRHPKSLAGMVVKYKKKIIRLIRHALGKQDFYHLKNMDSVGQKLFDRFISVHNSSALPAVLFLFGKEPVGGYPADFSILKTYNDMRNAAISGDTAMFMEVLKTGQLPFEVALGFRNTYKDKLDIEREVIYENSKMSARQAIQTQTAAKRTGAKVKVNFEKQDIYDLWKLLVHKLETKDHDDFDKLMKAIEKVGKEMQEKAPVDFGKTVAIFDASASMYGSPKRPYHPFLTGLSLVSTLPNIETVVYTGGKKVSTPLSDVEFIIVPGGGTELWTALLEAARLKPKTVLLISDGYENMIKGMFSAVYNQLRKVGHEFDLIHVNPVFAAEVKGARRVVEDIKPIVLSDYKYLKTETIFGLLTENPTKVKELLVVDYKRLIEGGE